METIKFEKLKNGVKAEYIKISLISCSGYGTTKIEAKEQLIKKMEEIIKNLFHWNVLNSLRNLLFKIWDCLKRKSNNYMVKI